MHTVTILRGLEARVAALPGLTLSPQSRATAVHQEGRKLLRLSAQSLAESAEALGTPPDGHAQPDSASVEAALAGYVRQREAVQEVRG